MTAWLDKLIRENGLPVVIGGTLIALIAAFVIWGWFQDRDGRR